MSFLLTDLEQLGQAALQDFVHPVSLANGPNRPDLSRGAERLEAKLEQLYAVAVTMARREESTKAVAAIWRRMVLICDQMARMLSPFCSARTRFLDIRNACEENRALHA
jgi:hypothetical protein